MTTLISEVKVTDLAAMAQQEKERQKQTRCRILCCASTACVSSGSTPVYQLMEEAVESNGLDQEVQLVQTGCMGLCSRGPMVRVQRQNEPDVLYEYVNAKVAPKIIAEHILQAPESKDAAKKNVLPEDIPFFTRQNRVVLALAGVIDPERLEEYVMHGGYAALQTVLTEMTPEEVIEEVTRSGLRGRGGGGFPTGVKWGLARKSQGWPKYVICNADEGDPGAFMDRSTLEGDPHAVLEGMTIAGYAIGAEVGYVYCRAEYPLAIKRLQIALDQAREAGLLGENILGAGFGFDIHIKEGAGAFVCGEETALMNSIQGERGQPWPRPPYPAVAGLWNQPSNVNNVKSYAYVPRILRLGADWFKNLGTDDSAGTAVFALTGMLEHTGLIEVPMGITLHDIVYEVGGGIPLGGEFKAVQTGGPLGGCLPAEHLDTPVDFDSLRAAGAVMGSGGMIVVDQTTCMVEFAKYFMQFACDESCGKCPPCRIGSTRMLEILERITEGKGEREDLNELRRLAKGMQLGSLCALGQLAPSPVLSTLEHFEAEYLAHIEEERCPAGKCRELITFEILTDLCQGCMVCGRSCPSQAIHGEKREPHTIDPEACERCGLCMEVCKFDAITVN